MDEKFNIIFDTYREDIFRLIYSYTLDVNDSKDILQETFIKFYEEMRSLPQDEIFIKKWLVKVAINKSKDYKKCFWKRKITIYEDSNKYSEFLSLKRDTEIFDFLNSLEKKYRIPIYMYYFEGYNISEIANLLNIGESTVKMRIKRAKEFLKKEMERV